MVSRLPVALASKVIEESDRTGLSYSDVIANAVAKNYGHPVVAHPVASEDQQIKMTA